MITLRKMNTTWQINKTNKEKRKMTGISSSTKIALIVLTVVLPLLASLGLTYLTDTLVQDNHEQTYRIGLVNIGICICALVLQVSSIVAKLYIDMEVFLVICTIALIATALWFVLKSKSQKDETVH